MNGEAEFDPRLLAIYGELSRDELTRLVVRYASRRLSAGGSSVFLRDNITGRYVLRGTTGLLDGADLRMANLGGANCEEASLRGVNLRECGLAKLNLRRADLRGCLTGSVRLSKHCVSLKDAILDDAQAAQEADKEQPGS